MVYSFRTTIAIGVVFIRGNLADVSELIQFVRKIGTKLLTIVGAEPFRTAIVFNEVVN